MNKVISTALRNMASQRGMSQLAIAADHIDTLEARVAELEGGIPKTGDGVALEADLTVWWWDDDDADVPAELRAAEVGSWNELSVRVEYLDECMDAGYAWLWHSGSDEEPELWATEAAARKAMGGGG